MGAVWVGKVACHENLVGLDLRKQILDYFHVVLRKFAFLYSPGLVEGEAEEMHVSGLYPDIVACNRGFGLADHGFDFAHFGGVDIAV